MSLFSKLFKSKPRPLDWQKFTEYFAKRIRDALELETEIRWGEDLDSTVIAIIPPDHDDNTPLTYLGNHYIRYLQNPEELETIAEACIAVIRQMLDGMPQVGAEGIFPVIKDTVWLENLRQMQAEKGEGGSLEENAVFSPIAGDIVLMYMLDTGTVMRSIDRASLAQMGVDDEEVLHRTALDNLRRHAQGHIQIEREKNSTLTQIFLDGDYESSLILLFDEILKLAPFLPANPVFIIPARNILIVCSPADENAVEALGIIAYRAAEESAYPISEQLYQFHNGTISLFRTN